MAGRYPRFRHAQHEGGPFRKRAAQASSRAGTPFGLQVACLALLAGALTYLAPDIPALWRQAALPMEAERVRADPLHAAHAAPPPVVIPRTRIMRRLARASFLPRAHGWARDTPESADGRLTTLERSVRYAGCSEARRAGAAPIQRGSPGYRAEMDGDGDGVACEPHRRR